MGEPFSERAIQAMFLARLQAGSKAQGNVGTAALMAGVLQADPSLAALAKTSGIQLRDLAGPESVGPGVAGGVTEAVKQALELAVGASHRHGAPRLGPEHILHGLLAQGELTRSLTARGFNVERLAESLELYLAGPGTPDPGPESGTAQRMADWLLGHL